MNIWPLTQQISKVIMILIIYLKMSLNTEKKYIFTTDNIKLLYNKLKQQQ